VKKGQPLSVVAGVPGSLWVLIDASDGTLFSQDTSSEFDMEQPGYSHEEIAIYTDEAAANRAATSKSADYGMTLTPQRVAIYANRDPLPHARAEKE
jgi:hypothetical protein